MSKIFALLTALALIGAVGAATVNTADARCGFVNGQWRC